MSSEPADTAGRGCVCSLCAEDRALAGQASVKCGALGRRERPGQQEQLHIEGEEVQSCEDGRLGRILGGARPERVPLQLGPTACSKGRECF